MNGRLCRWCSGRSASWSGLACWAIGLAIYGAWSRWRGRLYDPASRRLWRYALYMGPAGIVAMLAGWFTTEVGRQPWVVYGMMRTADAVSPHGAFEVGLTLIMFIVVYFLVFGVGTIYIIRLIKRGPAMDDPSGPEGGPGEKRTPARPISAASDPQGGDDPITGLGPAPGAVHGR